MVKKPTKATSKKTKPAKAKTKKVKASAKTEKFKATHDELMHYYREMLMIRRFEEKSGQMYGMGLIGGFCHLYIGQEAIVVGIQAGLKDGDATITGYRDHGHMLAAGIDPNAVMAELTGRATGISSGKGGSMHMFSTEKHFYGGHGIVGAQVPLGTGVAFANKYKGNDNISVIYFGDGASNQGQVFEAFNMAKLWNLPALFIIENNQYAMGTAVERATGRADLSHRGDSFAIPGKLVDGMNVLEVKAETDKAVKYIRSGKGPMILEMKTYRYRGHSMSDPAKYRTKEEVQKMRAEHDPIDQIKDRLLKSGKVTEEELKELDKELKAIVTKSADFAQASPFPEPSELYTDILIEGEA
ncbi:MAG: pyruvate dehydrogenase (acetyl-transferring) E1 component subunit alpha [Sphingomonadales bacterium]|nr:pyruvate dehydrogenase (acetyl-transferring) E1 component subunit alpha [Sphingomonadales bacterium]